MPINIKIGLDLPDVKEQSKKPCRKVKNYGNPGWKGELRKPCVKVRMDRSESDERHMCLCGPRLSDIPNRNRPWETGRML